MASPVRKWFGPRGGRLWWLLVLDVGLIVLSFALASVTHALIRFGSGIPPAAVDLYIRTFLYSLPLLIAVRIAAFGHFGLYRSGWRYAGLRDMLNIVKATTFSSVIVFVCIVFVHQYLRITYSSVFLGDWLILTILLALSRFSMRIKKEIIAWRQPGKRNVLVVGAGDAGAMLLRELMNNPALDYFPRGFIDDDPAKQGMTIQGVPVIGTRADLPTLIHTLFIDEVLIAMPSASGKAIREIIETCTTLGVRFKTLPSVADIVDGNVTISDLRDVDIMDILRRDPIQLDSGRIRGALHEQTVLATGGGGSIGGELCRQIAMYRPRELVLVELSEYNLYQIERELRGRFPNLPILPYIADIKNEARVRAIFERHKPAIVFHAAAYKHVPIMELNPVEAVLNNVKGTMNVAMEADRAGAAQFVMISTDKAVRPTSIMGATKRVAEMYVQSFNAISATRFVSVRFGNVLDSSGSVLPLFKEQILHGGPVTVTHPEVTRFFMLIPEAAQLVLEAATMGQGGEIFILDMGEPVRILDLARNLIQLMGRQPHVDIDIIFTGLRPGEKLHEELVYEGTEQPTRMKKIFIARSRPFAWDELHEKVSDLIAVATVNNVPRIYECLREIVTEYHPEERESDYE